MKIFRILLNHFKWKEKENLIMLKKFLKEKFIDYLQKKYYQRSQLVSRRTEKMEKRPKLIHSSLRQYIASSYRISIATCRDNENTHSKYYRPKMFVPLAMFSSVKDKNSKQTAID